MHYLFHFAVCILNLKKALNCGFFFQDHFKVYTMIGNDLSKIFSSMKLYHKNNIPIHEKIASISRISRYLCKDIFMTTVNGIIKFYKKVY